MAFFIVKHGFRTATAARHDNATRLVGCSSTLGIVGRARRINLIHDAPDQFMRLVNRLDILIRL